MSAAQTRDLRAPRFRLVTRFATGLGNQHPTENGFSFDTNSGLPIIAGASVKGLCRAAAACHVRDGSWSEREVEDLFGPARIGAEDRAFQGSVRFYDVFPVDGVRFGVDIVNCHHPDYCRELGKVSDAGRQEIAGPRETDKPNPVPFLCLEPDATFVLPFLATAEADAERVQTLLTWGLDWLGLGAKTAVDYGRFAAAE